MVKLDSDLTINARINNNRYNFRSDMTVAVLKHRLTMVAKSPLVPPVKFKQLFNKLPFSYRQIKSDLDQIKEEFLTTNNS